MADSPNSGAPAPKPDAEAVRVVPVADPKDKGQNRFSLRTFEHLVGAAINTVPGTTPLDAKLAGLAGRAFPRLVVQTDPDRQFVAVDATIAVIWPSPVTGVAEATRRAISEAIREQTGYTTTRVNVNVGAAVPGERVSATAVDARPDITAWAPPSKEFRVRAPQTKQGVRVRNIGSTPFPREAWTPDTPHAEPLRQIDRGQEPQVRSIDSEPRDMPEVPIRTAPEQPLREVRDPAPEKVWEPRTPEPALLRPCGDVTPAAPQRRVSTPPPVPVRSVRAPQPRPLNQFQVVPANPHPTRVAIPRPEPLRAITIQPYLGGSHG